MPDLTIGCSGFSYKHWREVFYPHGLAQNKWLDYYAGIFPSVELNVTFYHLPSPAAFRTWERETPHSFLFSVKGSRYITHIKRLTDPAEPVGKFFEAASLLHRKLAVVLWQFPPGFRLNMDRLVPFLSLLQSYGVRHAFEFRHESWITPSVIDLLTRHKAALCMADSPPYLDDLPVTADFVYIRRHGRTANHGGSYSTAQLAQDAARIRAYLGKGKDVFIYFNNDPHGYAPANARELMAMFPQAHR